MILLICNAVVLGAVLAGIVQGTIIGLAFWILGIPKPFLSGAMTAVFGLIPLVGSAPMGIGGTVYLFTTGQPIKAIVMLAAFGLAAVSDNVIKPLVLTKGKTALHPLLGLISVLGGLKAFGVAGIFLGPVITALTIVLLKLFHHRVKGADQQQIVKE
jgi:predicted PurR-regulated permease PerM